MSKEVILTGIRSNEEPHIGNYLGAMLPMVELQRKYAGEYQLNMFVPDLHSFTTPIDHSTLFNNTLRNLKYFIAAGLDIDNNDTFVYRQSYISAHSELCWILDCFTGFGEANRMVEFKDKSERLGHDQVSVGLFNYPVLMAADIFLYDARWIPVGEDQRQHLELARTLANRLNNKFASNLFVVPEETAKQAEFAGLTSSLRIKSLRNPDKKMSKSISDPAGTILLSDKPSEAAKKILSATTDSFGEIQFDLKTRPGISNLLQLLALMTNTKLETVINNWQGKTQYGELKKTLAHETEQFLLKFQNNYSNINEDALISKLESSEESMKQIANSKLLKVQKAIGLRPNN
jgi:tryptophanyl-tRNA synthetase